MGELIRDHRLDILLHFVELENNNVFIDKNNRQYMNVIDIITGHLNLDKGYAKRWLSELISLGLITREYGNSMKLRNQPVSFLYYNRKNKIRLKELFEKEPIFMLINKEFYMLILE